MGAISFVINTISLTIIFYIILGVFLGVNTPLFSGPIFTVVGFVIMFIFFFWEWAFLKL
ncbi:MAG: hypothetical protein AABW72_02385 [archaeon]